jgi:hypothetical protein
MPGIAETGIFDNGYRCTMGVTGISLGVRRSARENIGCTWESDGTKAGITNKF